MKHSLTCDCGDANPQGSVSLSFKGGCGKSLSILDAFRCTGCGGYFHRDCIFNHFEQEEGHSKAHRALHKIRLYAEEMKENGIIPSPDLIIEMCKIGLNRDPEKISLLP